MMMRAITALFLILALTTGCSQSTDPWNPKKSPNPVKRYEVTAEVSDAPGPWDAVTARAFFDIVNRDSVPRSSFTGAQNGPNRGYPIEMKQVGEKIWRGYFYRDFLQDEDYFKLGVCHWDVTGVGAGFIAQRIHFSASRMLDGLLKNGPQTTYFKKKAYGEAKFEEGMAPDYSADDPEVTQHLDEFFSITVTVKEAVP